MRKHEPPLSPLFDDKTIREKFFNAGLTPKQIEKVYSIAEEFLSPALSYIFSLRHESESIAELKNFFGNEEKMKDTLIEINAFGENFLPANAFE